MKLELTKEEIEKILNLLAQAPYGQVYQLIQNIQQQAQNQENDEP